MPFRLKYRVAVLPERRLITRTQRNSSLAGFKNEHLPAITYSPTFEAWGRSDVFGNDETLVADFLGGVGFNCETRSGGHGKRNRAVAGPRRKLLEITVQRDFAVAG